MNVVFKKSKSLYNSQTKETNQLLEPYLDIIKIFELSERHF